MLLMDSAESCFAQLLLLEFEVCLNNFFYPFFDFNQFNHFYLLKNKQASNTPLNTSGLVNSDTFCEEIISEPYLIEDRFCSNYSSNRFWSFDGLHKNKN